MTDVSSTKTGCEHPELPDICIHLTLSLFLYQAWALGTRVLGYSTCMSVMPTADALIHST